MKTEAFTTSLQSGKLADKTIGVRKNALLRVERSEGIDLDDEFDRDEMIGLLERFTYSRADEANGRPNPTSMNVGERSTLSVLRWYKSHLNQYRKWRLSGGVEEWAEDEFGLAETSEESELDAPSAYTGTFGLEADMQAILRENIAQLEPGLTIIDGGVERRVGTGFIDILARDEDGATVVIELKAGTARDAVIAQTLGYMADMAVETSAPVRGIIIASGFSPRIERATEIVPNLSLKTYRYSFEFR